MCVHITWRNKTLRTKAYKICSSIFNKSLFNKLIILRIAVLYEGSLHGLSIPAVVKNTNETYLMTTPFEETRSFNILGLTYENSRDVQIEIKVSKKGYEDQVKRFNVRQAIDQQEISGFFEMVAKEE